MNQIHKVPEETTCRPAQLDVSLRWDPTLEHLVIHELGRLPADARLDWIRTDQRQRWLKGFRIPIEGYLELPPLTNLEPDLLLDLIYSEYILRQTLGEEPSVAEYLGRFPNIETPLRRLFAIDQALLPVVSLSPPAAQPFTGALPTKAIGKYPILSLLAEGGQGVVYRALHPTLAKEVVIKWSKHATNSTRDRDQLLAEGRLLARIEHPNLVRIFDLDFHDGRPFLVMESVDGLNLEQYFDRARPGPKQVAALVARIARALEVVHRKGIIHRDIKPKNILIDEKDQPKLIDFGIAQSNRNFTEPRTDSPLVSGTLAYISPEQANGDEASFGPRTDIFGLGGVLHYLLTGSAPYLEKKREPCTFSPSRETGTTRLCNNRRSPRVCARSARRPCRPIRRTATPAPRIVGGPRSVLATHGARSSGYRVCSWRDCWRASSSQAWCGTKQPTEALGTTKAWSLSRERRGRRPN